MKKAVAVSLAVLCVGAISFPAAAPAATPGKIAYVSDSDGDDEIWTIPSAGGTPTQLTFNGGTEEDPSWSPDGRRIAFVSDQDPGTDKEIWVMNADGGAPQQLTSTTANEFGVDWSPDGTRLVFNMSSSPNVIWSINVDGTNLRQLTNPPGPNDDPYGANFSPDGTLLTVMNPQAMVQTIGVLSSQGGAVTNLTSFAGSAPDYTADGKRIVFWSGEASFGGPDNEILSMTSAGTDVRQLTSNSGAGSDDRAPRASRDGLNRIAYRNNAGGDNELWVMNADGTGQTQLTFNAFNDRGADWQPNVKCGSGIATIVGTSASEVLRGGPGRDIISGQGGKDKIKGLGARDVICGDKGKDNLNGGPGPDFLIGGKGNDKTVGGKGKDKCVGGGGDDSGKGCEKEKSL